jgi:predicted ArsR family transcriptional regulator
MDNQPVTDSSRSRDRILELLLRSGAPLSVQSLATAVGISRNAAHQQVSALEREGLIERASAIRTKGRPSQGFQLSTAGKATFPRQYSLLAKELLQELSQHLGADDLHRAMQRIGKTVAAGLSAKVGANADQELIAGLMRELGYESNVVTGPAGVEIEAHNCVFHDLAMADPSVCEVDLALLRSLSGKSVDHRSCMARGETSCRFAFADSKAPA